MLLVFVLTITVFITTEQGFVTEFHLPDLPYLSFLKIDFYILLFSSTFPHKELVGVSFHGCFDLETCFHFLCPRAGYIQCSHSQWLPLEEQTKTKKRLPVLMECYASWLIIDCESKIPVYIIVCDICLHINNLQVCW